MRERQCVYVCVSERGQQSTGAVLAQHLLCRLERHHIEQHELLLVRLGAVCTASA